LCAEFVVPSAYAAAPAGKIPITKLSDLPPHTYTLPMKPSELISNADAAHALAKQVQANVQADLDKYDIQDATALRRRKATLDNCASLLGDDSTAKQLLLEVRNSQDKPAARLTSGVLGETVLDLRATKPADFDAALKDELSKRFSAMPYVIVQDYL